MTEEEKKRGLTKEQTVKIIDDLEKQCGVQGIDWDGRRITVDKDEQGNALYRVYAVSAPKYNQWRRFQKDYMKSHNADNIDPAELQKQLVIDCLIDDGSGKVREQFKKDLEKKPLLVQNLFEKVHTLAKHGDEDLKKS